jgi:hypothetical protein
MILIFFKGGQLKANQISGDPALFLDEIGKEGNSHPFALIGLDAKHDRIYGTKNK